MARELRDNHEISAEARCAIQQALFMARL